MKLHYYRSKESSCSSSLLAKREIDGFETPLSRLISNVVEQFILPAWKVPGPVVSLETILESYRLSNQDNLRSSRQVNVRLEQQYITETRPGIDIMARRWRMADYFPAELSPFLLSRRAQHWKIVF